MLERLDETKRLWEKYLARHAFLADSVVIVLFVPSRFKRSFRCGFLWFFACSCCCSHVHGRSPMETMRWQADASCSRIAAPRRRLVRRVFFRLREQPNHQNTRICWGQPYLAIVLAHVFLAIFGACTALPPKPSVERRVRFSAHFFEHSSACGNMVIFSRVPLSFSVSLPRIWLSRSTSKIDALDDDETPLRLTASQTATTRGVMVCGVMGALDIAPTLYFVEPGLKLNAEELIKAMDECIVPNCTALLEPPGVSFYRSWTTRRRTLPGMLVSTTAQCCTAQMSFNHRVPQICLPETSFCETSTACSASSPCQSRRTAGTFWPSCITGRGQAVVRCSRKSAMLGSAGSRLAWPPNPISSTSTDMAESIVPLKDTAQETLHKIRHLTLRRTLHRHRRHHKHRQHVVKPCCSVTHPRTINFGAPQPQNGSRSPKNLENSPLLHYFLDDRSADGGKHSAKMRELEIFKNTHFYDVSFSLGKKHTLQ